MTIIYFILILGGIVFIHEFGHFIFAKKAGVYIYEFSIGMGPQIIKWKSKKDETVYSIRLFPIGGFVQMAGEEVEPDENIPENKRMQSKTWLQRISITIAGILFNFLLAIVLIFIVGLINGAATKQTYITSLQESSNAYKAGLRDGYQILQINNRKNNVEMLTLELVTNVKKDINVTYKDLDGNTKTTTIKSDVEEKDGKTQDKYLFALTNKKETGILASIKYAFNKTIEFIEYMFYVILYLITGKLSVTNLSGPVGIFSLVGQTAQAGLLNLVYLMAMISINVGFINFLPLPAFDGGRILFLIIEKIKGSPVNPKVENTIHTIGLGLLMILMIFITYNDILRLFR